MILPLLVLLLIAGAAANRPFLSYQLQGPLFRSLEDENFIFSAPELSIIVRDARGHEKYLEAFKIKDNDQILLEMQSDPNKISRLTFLSIGLPTIVTPSYRLGTGAPETSAVVPTENGFHFFVRMLPKALRDVLATRADSKYKTFKKLDQSQIVLLTPDSFTCSAEFLNRNGPAETAMGHVKTFRRDPLKVAFKVEPYSFIHSQIRNSSLTSRNVIINCEIAKRAQRAQTDQLVITSQQIDQLNLEAKLFGGADSVFVSREQMNLLGREVMNKLKIFESYETDGQFESNFVSDFLAKVGVKDTFTPRPIAEVLASLSPYNVDKDLRPEEIIKECSDVLKIESAGGKQRIIANRESTLLEKESKGVSGSATAGGEAWGFKGSVSAEYATNKSSEWANSSKSLDDQLHEINSRSQSAIKWQREGLKIIPKSLDVGQLSKSQLSQSMSFGRIRRKLTSADFHRPFELKWPLNDGITRKSCRLWKKNKKCSSTSDCCAWNSAEYKVVQSCGNVKKGKICGCLSPGEKCGKKFQCCDGSVCEGKCPAAAQYYMCDKRHTPSCQEGLTCVIDSVSLQIYPDDDLSLLSMYLGRCV